MKGGDSLEELLFIQLDKENNKLNMLGDVLLNTKVDPSDLHSNIIYLNLAVEFETITDSLNHVYSAMVNCMGNQNLLASCIEFINALSFMIAAFSVKLDLLREDNAWRN